MPSVTPPEGGNVVVAEAIVSIRAGPSVVGAIQEIEEGVHVTELVLNGTPPPVKEVRVTVPAPGPRSPAFEKLAAAVERWASSELEAAREFEEETEQIRRTKA